MTDSRRLYYLDFSSNVFCCSEITVTVASLLAYENSMGRTFSQKIKYQSLR
ncbi:conserved hypothetical protein [Brochothrix thermosphacta]|nr:conserved hypothetical protein [Brochothrix thermosphacta]